MARPRFHLAFPVHDIKAARRFYVDLLGCSVGREAERWIDFDFHGHQVSAHLADEDEKRLHNAVDGQQVPVRHFGLILEWNEWQVLADRLAAAAIEFLVEPYIRFEGEPGEQGTFFVTDPSGNALEFKTFRDEGEIFRRE